MVETPVDLVVNCFERNLTEVTEPGFIDNVRAQNRHRFTKSTLLVNNVTNPARAAARADAVVNRGEADAWAFVADHVDEALRRMGLRHRQFGRYLHWSDCCLVALCLSGSDWVCYWDPGTRLASAFDWISVVILLAEHDPRVAVGNPQWGGPGHEAATAAIEAREMVNRVALGYGFSDQVFLARRSEFARPVFRAAVPLALRSPISLRYPSAGGLFFEQLADAYMRTNGRLRATVTDAYWVPEHASTYGPEGPREHLRAAVASRVLRLLNRYQFASPRLHR